MFKIQQWFNFLSVHYSWAVLNTVCLLWKILCEKEMMHLMFFFWFKKWAEDLTSLQVHHRHCGWTVKEKFDTQNGIKSSNQIKKDYLPRSSVKPGDLLWDIWRNGITQVVRFLYVQYIGGRWGKSRPLRGNNEQLKVQCVGFKGSSTSRSVI